MKTARIQLKNDFTPYPEYKDSGIPWIGEIPKEWEGKKISSVFAFPKDKVSDEDYEPLSVTYGGIKKQVETAAKSDDGTNRKRLLKGDIAINGRSDRKGAVGMSDYDGSISLVYHVLRKRYKDMDTKFFHYLFRSKLFSEEFYRWGRGIVDDLWTTRSDEMKRIGIPVPSIETQKKIAQYLDEKTMLIDTIIEKKKKLIELLREKRTAVINHAVTKGLNLDVELVESGIDWLGNVPKGWQVKKLKSGFKFEKGKDAGKFTQEFVGSQENSGEYPVYSGQTENEGVLGTINSYKYEFPYGVLFSTTVGAKAMTTRYLKGRFSLSQNCVLMIPNRIASPGYFYFLLTIGFRRMRDDIPSHMQPSLRVSDLIQFDVVFPGMEEQIKIAGHLEGKDSDFTRASLLMERSIESLKEFKSSLISNVVTGKIKV